MHALCMRNCLIYRQQKHEIWLSNRKHSHILIPRHIHCRVFTHKRQATMLGCCYYHIYALQVNALVYRVEQHLTRHEYRIEILYSVRITKWDMRSRADATDGKAPGLPQIFTSIDITDLWPIQMVCEQCKWHTIPSIFISFDLFLWPNSVSVRKISLWNCRNTSRIVCQSAMVASFISSIRTK